MASCLKNDLEDVASSEACDVTNVDFEYRWAVDILGNDGKPTGVSELRYITLTANKIINNESKTITVKLTVPNVNTTFTSEIRNKVSLDGIVGMFTVSPAAKVTPLNGAPSLGNPGNFSQKKYSYRITSAAGNYHDWILDIIEFNKP